jgi:hypothetical protein
MTMKTMLLSMAVIALQMPGLRVSAAEEPTPPPHRPDPAALRERAKKLAPDERQKLLREFREKHGLGGTNRGPWEKRWEELRRLPPEERAARLKELRQEIQENGGRFRLHAEERDVKRKEIKERVDAQIAELQKRQADGALTDTEQRRLERMKLMSKRLEEGQTNLPRRLGPPGRPPQLNPNQPSAASPDGNSLDGTLPPPRPPRSPGQPPR